MSRSEQGDRFVIDEALAGVRLDIAVARSLTWTRNQARRAIADGAVYLDGSRCRVAAQAMAVGQELRVMPAAPDRTQVGGGGLDIVCQDTWLLVLDKPAGLPTQPPPRGGDALSLRAATHLGMPPGEVHRLDRDVSGLVIYGCQREATRDLAGQFRERTAGRRYLALVRTALPVPDQAIEEPICEVSPGRMAVGPTGMPARTEVKQLAFDPEARLALLLVTLRTGRTHQIRVHLAHAVGALAGDAMYGDPFAHDTPGFATGAGRVGLHAAILQCYHPGTGTPVRWVREPGPDFWALAEGSNLALPWGWDAIG